MTILTLASDPTLVATAGAKTQYGTFGGRLYQHTTGTTDTKWVEVSDLLGFPGPILTLAADPLSTPAAGAFGQFGTFGGTLYLHLGANADTYWVNLATVRGVTQGLHGPLPGLVYSAPFDVAYTDFAGLGAVAKIDLANLPTGAVLVSANAHATTVFSGGAASAVTCEFDDQSNGTAEVVRAFDVHTDPTLGANSGRGATGRAITYATCTLRVTGDTAANLTAGAVHLELLYRIP